MSKAKNTLVIGPNFFSMMKEIVHEINNQSGYCIYWDERFSNNFIVKIIYRLQLDYVFFLQKKKYFQRLKNLIELENINFIYLIDVESFSRADIIELLSIDSIVEIYFYTWDSIKNKSKYLSYRDLLAKCSTFDPEDAKNFQLNYIPLYANNSFVWDQSYKKNIDIYACCTLHSNRPSMLNFVRREANSLNLNIKFDLYYYNFILFMIRSLFSSDWRRNFKFVSFSGFSSYHIAENTKSSRYVLDLSHPKQAGLTARTFEALRAGAKLITNNRYAKLLLKDFEDRILFFDNELSLLKILNAIKNNRSQAKEISEPDNSYLSLEYFVANILEGTKLNG